MIEVGEGTTRRQDRDTCGVIGRTTVSANGFSPSALLCGRCPPRHGRMPGHDGAREISGTAAGRRATGASVGQCGCPSYLRHCGSGITYCWGWNRDGELGDASTTDRLAPAAVVGSSGFVRVSAGGGHTCAVSGGGASCWGFNLSGQLGDSSTVTRTTPTPVTSGSNLVVIATGGAYTCGVRSDSSAVCWGFGRYGQLGTGDRQDRRSPTPVMGGLKFLTVSTGAFHTCGLAADSTAFCWGLNDHGQLGDSIADTTRPAAVHGGIKFAMITVGSL